MKPNLFVIYQRALAVLRLPSGKRGDLALTHYPKRRPLRSRWAGLRWAMACLAISAACGNPPSAPSDARMAADAALPDSAATPDAKPSGCLDMDTPEPLQLGIGNWPGIAIAPGGTVYIAYRHDDGATIQPIDGETLGTPLRLGDLPTYRDDGIAIAPDGAVHVIAGALYHYVLRGDTLTDTRIASGVGAALALDSQGKPHVSFFDHISMPQRLQYAIQDAKGTWQITDVASAYPVNWHSDIAVDTGGHAHIVYADEDLQTSLYWTNRTGVWTSEDLGFYLNDPIIVVDSARAPHVFYGNGSDILHGTRGAHGWSFAAIAQGTGIGISAMLDAAGTFHIAFTTDAGVSYARNTDSTWEVFAVADVGTDYPWVVGLDIDALGAVHLVYNHADRETITPRVVYQVLCPG